MSDATIEEIVSEAKKPGTFSIINALKDRAYPEDVIDVYLDEDAAYKASVVFEEISELKIKLSRKSGEVADEIQAQIDEAIIKREEILERLKESKFVFTIKGISEGKREELLKVAIAKFPEEFEETINELGQRVKEEVPNIERDKLFTNLLWLAHVKSVQAPSGEVQSSFSIDDVEELRSSLPIAASTAINEGMEKLRVASAVFMMSVNEDFLAKR